MPTAVCGVSSSRGGLAAAPPGELWLGTGFTRSDGRGGRTPAGEDGCPCGLLRTRVPPSIPSRTVTGSLRPIGDALAPPRPVRRAPDRVTHRSGDPPLTRRSTPQSLRGSAHAPYRLGHEPHSARTTTAPRYAAAGLLAGAADADRDRGGSRRARHRPVPGTAERAAGRPGHAACPRDRADHGGAAADRRGPPLDPPPRPAPCRSRPSGYGRRAGPTMSS